MNGDYFIDPLVKNELDKIRSRVLNKDTDYVFVIDGEVGSGKSVLSMQFAKYLDPDFNINNVCFTANEFIKIIRDPNTKKGSAIIMDEAFSSSSARQALSNVNHAINSLAMEMRQRNLFVFFILPSYFDLDKIIALHRSRALFHVYFADGGDRRYLTFDMERKKTLYLKGKKTYSYKWPKAIFPPGRFNNYYTIDEQAYREKKAQAFEDRPKVNRNEQRWILQRDALVKLYLNATHKSFSDVSDDLKAMGVPGLEKSSIEGIFHKENGENP